MSLIKAEKINKSYGLIDVLSDISFSIDKGQKVALVGNNGTGKTTLLKIIAGIEEYDSGSLNILKNTRVGYLPQDTSFVEDESVETYLKRTATNDDNVPDYDFAHKMKLILSGFGLNNIDLQHNVSKLSSGQKSKIILAGILLKGVDLLLLDEPTNNLDLPALIWLENYIKETETACILISHDRRFLDKVVNKIFEIDWLTHNLNITNGTYSDYLETLKKRLHRQKEEYSNQQEEIDRLSKRAHEMKMESARGSKWVGSDNDKYVQGYNRDMAGKAGRKGKVIDKRVDQIDKIEKPIERSSFEISLNAEKNPGTMDIRLLDVIAGYSNSKNLSDLGLNVNVDVDGNNANFKIGPISFELNYGQRVAIMGLNGTGKSTLLKTITGQLKPLEGKVEFGSGLKIGNMMQEHETLPKDKTLLEFLTERAYTDEQDSYVQLAKFGFNEKQMRKPINALSPGGRARLLLSLFSAQSVNLLVLDEPTNHLDIEAVEALEETLKTYKGSVLIVSHDRYFLEQAALDTTYLLSDGKLTRIPDYKSYVENL
ncbi:MAG: ABC-F family ATP-binding cassette domain-containing protein [bacterium]